MNFIYPPSFAIERQLTRAAGIARVDAPMIADAGYDDKAIVAAGDFETGSFDDAAAHEAAPAVVAIVDLRLALAPVLRSFLDASTMSDASSIAARVDASDILTECLRGLSGRFTWSQSRFKTIGLAINEPGHRTVTMDTARGVRLGLHLDSWDKAAFDERGRARNRICVNIGCRARYFLFVPVTMKTIVSCVADEHWPTETALGRAVTATDVVRVFLVQNPSTRVFRLEVPPGWAYIAPTEDLPHDAQTPAGAKFDFAVHAMADFTPIYERLAIGGWQIASLATESTPS